MSAERIGSLLSKLAGGGAGYLENTECGGALLYVTKKQAIAMAASGRYRWVQDPARMPDEGRHSWRIACRGEIMRVQRRAELAPDATDEQRAAAPTYTVTYGLCAACNGMELAMRKHLAKEAKDAEEAAKGLGRKRGYRKAATDDDAGEAAE